MSCRAWKVKKKKKYRENINTKFTRTMDLYSSKNLTCYHKCLSISQTCTWAESPEAPPQTAGAYLLCPSSCSTVSDKTFYHTWLHSLQLVTQRCGRLMSRCHLIFAPQQVVVLAADAGANKVNSMILNPEVEISEPEHQPWWKSEVTHSCWWMSSCVMFISSPVVNNFGSLFTVKGLRVHDVFELVYSLRGKLHMCCQVTV